MGFVTTFIPDGHNVFNGRRVSSFTDLEHAALAVGDIMRTQPPYGYPLAYAARPFAEVA
jgi:hypothetical protein